MRRSCWFVAFVVALGESSGFIATGTSLAHRRQHARPHPRLCDVPERDPLRPTIPTGDTGGLENTDANSFGEYLLPYAGLVLLAFALAAAAFSALVLGG